MKYVVFGANGYIGSYLYHRLISDGYDVIGTSHRIKEENLILYDIQDGDIDFLLKKAGKDSDMVAIICIAVSNIDKCYENYNQAYDINVTKTKTLIYKLLEQNFQIIYFSSDNVFDGVSGNYTEESLTNPINKYGSMKEEMEQYLLTNMSETCILRIPKVVSMQEKKQNVFTEWMMQKKNGIVRCIRGNILSFVCIEDIYQVCLTVAERKMHGLYNIAGDKSYSRAELAGMFYEKLGVQGIGIKECNLKEFAFKENRPLNISMSNLKFRNETGHHFMSMETVIEMYVSTMKTAIHK